MPGSRKHKKPATETIGHEHIIDSPVSKRTRSAYARNSSESGSNTSCVIAKVHPTAPVTTRNHRETHLSTAANVQVAKSRGRKPKSNSRIVDKRVNNKSSAGKMTSYMPMEVDDIPCHGNVSNVAAPRYVAPSGGEDEKHCTVCMSEIDNPKKLDKCGHTFCRECIDQCFLKINPVCPICGTVYGNMTGNMPPGTMTTSHDNHSQLEGYHGCGVIIIQYHFPNGHQTHEHPHPGRLYSGTRRVAYLPNNEEGKKVHSLLRRAFDARMTFTVGRSATTGLDDQVIWNDIHHKTSLHGGATGFGYPDPTYLRRVQEELAVKGIK